MSRGLAGWLLVFGTMSLAAAQTGKGAKVETPDVAILEKAVLDAPGPVGCCL